MIAGRREIHVAGRGLAFTAILVLAGWSGAAAQPGAPRFTVSEESARCVRCHALRTPGINAQWEDSAHASAEVGCFECHQAAEDDPDGFVHNGTRIATIVTPMDCAGCHGGIAEEFRHSHHSKAAQFVGSLDNILGEVVEGPIIAANGCQQCHGSTVTFLRDGDGGVKRDAEGKPLIDPTTWPNTGIGRVNPDGSWGTCSACHSRHAFAAKMARQPEVCGKCHMGPDHPQMEIYEESKHGIAFRTRIDDMALDSDTWVVGRDYSAAPTCSTCHMSATRSQPITHDVGARISWTLRPVVSKKLESWEERRAAMKDTCHTCHTTDYVDAFYASFDSAVEMYNRKFGQPALDIVNALRKQEKLTPDPFDEELEWTFFRLWHHEGRRARMGVSMQGPDYTQWHGFFEVAENFYFKFIPQAREAAHGDAFVGKVIDGILDSPEHAWKKGMSPEDRRKIDEFYRQRYGVGSGH